jgi:Fe-S-cluster containining protein
MPSDDIIIMHEISKNLEKAYRLTENIFPNISDVCKTCDICCRTYGWLLSEEAVIYQKVGVPVAIINDILHCIDSFQRNKNGKVVLSIIPKCIFYKNGCSIYKDRPLECRFYPVETISFGKIIFIGINTECKFISSLSICEKSIVFNKILSLFEKAPNSIINEYLDLCSDIENISESGEIKIEQLLKAEKKGNKWEWCTI